MIENIKPYQSILFGIGITMAIFGMLQLIGFNGLYGQDSHEYLRYSKYLKNNLLTIRAANDYFWPVMYPILGALLGVTKIPIAYILQFISIFSWVFSAIYILKIIQIIYNENGVFYVLIFYALSPFIFRFGSVIMSDMVCVLFLVIGFFHLFRYDKKQTFSALFYSVLFFSLSFHTRYISVVLFLIPFLILFIKHFKSFPIYYYLLLLLSPIIISIPHILIKSTSIAPFEHSWLMNWSFLNFFKRDFITIEGIKNYTLPNIIANFLQYFHPRYFYITALLLFFMKPKKWNLLLAIPIGVYVLFLSGIPYQNTRFILLSFPFFILLLYPSFQDLLIKVRLKKIFYITLITIQIPLLIYSFSKIYNLNKMEKSIVKEIINVSTKKRIYTSGFEGPLRSYSNKEVIGLWLDTIPIYHRGMFVINESVMRNYTIPNTLNYNYKNLKKNYTLKKIKNLKKNWTLYEIQ